MAGSVSDSSAAYQSALVFCRALSVCSRKEVGRFWNAFVGQLQPVRLHPYQWCVSKWKRYKQWLAAFNRLSAFVPILLHQRQGRSSTMTDLNSRDNQPWETSKELLRPFTFGNIPEVIQRALQLPVKITTVTKKPKPVKQEVRWDAYCFINSNWTLIWTFMNVLSPSKKSLPDLEMVLDPLRGIFKST